MLQALLLSAFVSVLVQATPSAVKGLNIDNGPAPPPDQGPPGAIHADRDPSHLKYELFAIVGSYVVWTLLTIILILFVGRRLRRRAWSLHSSQQMVQMKSFHHMEASPISPIKSPNFSLRSPKSPDQSSTMTKSWGRKGHKVNPSEYSISTVASYDEAHRAKNMEQLTELYAAVMAHDEEKEARIKISPLTESSEGFDTPQTPRIPPEFAHLYQANRLPHPMAPTPVDNQFPEDAHSRQLSRSSVRTTRTTPLSVVSVSSKPGGMASPKRPRRISIRSQPISPPMGSADLRDAHLYGDNVPLSPRHYDPGPPPLTPGQQRNLMQQQQQYRHQDPDIDSIQSQLQPHAISTPQQRERRLPPTLALRSAAASDILLHPEGSQTSLPNRAPKALPFREVYGDTSLRSAPPTKTTFLERPDRQHGPKSAMRTGVVPQTPYSPYMPFTPMTPITPRRLATREELKRQRKEERLKALDENDLVGDDGWGA